MLSQQQANLVNTCRAQVDNPEDLDDDTGLESLAVEINSGNFTLRTLWQWTCYQAAEQIGARAEQTSAAGRRGPSAGMYEARNKHCLTLRRHSEQPELVIDHQALRALVVLMRVMSMLVNGQH